MLVTFEFSYLFDFAKFEYALDLFIYFFFFVYVCVQNGVLSIKIVFFSLKLTARSGTYLEATLRERDTRARMIPGVSPVAESSRAACKTCNFLLLRVLLAWLWPSYCVDFLNRVKKECAAGRKPFLSLFSARLYIIYCTQKSLAKNISFPAALASVIFVLGLLEGKSPDQVSLSAGNRNAFEVEFLSFLTSHSCCNRAEKLGLQ